MGISSRGITLTEILTAVTQSVSQQVWNALHNAVDFRDIIGTWAIMSNVDYGQKDLLSNWDGGAGAQNDEVALPNFFIPYAGTYTLYLMARTDTNGGKIHVLIDGADVGSVDEYSNPGVQDVLLSVSLGSLTVGDHILRFKVKTKHASSTSYFVFFQSYTIVKT